MLPTLDDLRSAPPAVFSELLALYLNPISFQVTERIIELKLIDIVGPHGSPIAELPSRAKALGAIDAGSEWTVDMALPQACWFGLLQRDHELVRWTDLSRLFLAKDAPLAMDGLRQRMAILQEGVNAIAAALRQETAKVPEARQTRRSDDEFDTVAELRQSKRFELNLLVNYPDREYAADWTQNVSAGGLFIPTDNPLKEGDIVHMRISALGLLEPFSIEATVAWVRPATAGQGRGVGIKANDPRLSELAQTSRKAYIRSRTVYNERSRRYYWDSAVILMRIHLQRALTRHRRVTDVGSASAGFPCLLKKCFPHLAVRAVDFSYLDADFRQRTLNALAEEKVEIELLAADLLSDELPGGSDLVTVNRVLSGVSEKDRPFWLKKLYELLEPGGSVVLVDFFSCQDPTFDAVLGCWWTLMMGWSHYLKNQGAFPHVQPRTAMTTWIAPPSCTQIQQQLAATGFQQIEVTKVIPPFVMIEGLRP
jgi:Tfp pilus assembly protein PilZ